MGERRRKVRRKDSSKAADERRESDDRRGGAERRRDERVAAEVMVEVETSGRRTYRRTANISMGGVAFHQPIPFRAHDADVGPLLNPLGLRNSVHALFPDQHRSGRAKVRQRLAFRPKKVRTRGS